MALDLGNLTAGIEIDATRAIATLTDFERKVDDTSQALDGLDKKKVNVAPSGKRELDAAAQSAQGLEKGLDKASASAGKIKAPSGVAGGLDKAAGSAAGLADELDRAGREAAELSRASGPSALDGALGGLASTVKGLLPQITAVAAAGTVISKGWDRLTGIDTATFKLKGLGHEAGSVSDIMDSALASVDGTAFGLADAANAAANAVASGVKPGAELTQVLTTMADTAAVSGASLQDMGLIFNSVMAKGKLQGDDMLQLMGRSVPVLQLIADELGITAAEASKMASEGAISFEIFEKAMREGFGGAAQEMGQSIQGSLQNVGAAVGRLGEAIMGPLMEDGPAAIAGFTEGVNVLTNAVNAAYGAWDKVPGALKVVIASLAAAKAAQMLLNTEMAKGLALKISDGYASASKGISDFASSLGEAYRNTRLANPEMGALSSGLTVLAGSGGVASTAMGGLKGAAGGLLSALGGPWGLALGGATVALGMFMKHVQDTKQAQQEAEAATQSWADVLGQAEGKINDQVQQHAIAQVQALGLTSTYSKLGYSTADVAAAVMDLDDSYGPLIAHLDDVIRAGTDTTSIQAQMSSRGFIMDGAAEEAQELKEKLVELNGQYEDGADKAQENADATSDLSMKVADLHRNANDAAGGMDPLIGVFEAMGAEAKTVDEAIKNLTDRMLGLSDDPSLRMQSYLSSAAQDLQKFGDALSGGMGGFDVATGHFDMMDEQGRKLHGTMMDLRTSVNEYAAAAYHSYKEMGMSGPEAAAAAADAANGITDSFEEQMLAAGRTQEEVDALIERYGLLPGDVLTHVQAAGIETATDLINGLDERLVHIDQERYTITVDADAISFTQEQAKALGYTWEDIGNNVIQLTADDEQARHAIEDMAAKTEHLGTQDNTIVLRGDSKDLVDKLNEAAEMGAELRTNPATLPVVADTDKAREGIEQLGLEVTELPNGELFVHTNSDEEMQKLLNLGAETAALPEGYIEITDTSAENLEALRRLGVNVRTLPDGSVVITDNASKVKENIERNLSRAVLNKTGKVTIDIIENVRRVFSRSTGGNIPERAAGGSIPKLAAGDRTHGGYRLPMSGPGTERTDGILGVDGRGIPTAWVDRGEFVTNRAATAKWLRTLMAINRDDPREVVNSLMHELPMLANGGVLSAAEIKDALAHMDNGQYVMGGFSTRQTDCSGGVSAAVNTALGLPTFESRMSTVTIGPWLSAKGFQPGRGDDDDIVVGWYDYGGGAAGHTSMRLQDGTYIESGGNTGQGFTIGGAAGGLDGRGYTNFMHLPYDSTQEDGGGFLTGDDGARTSMGSRVDYRAEFDGVDIQDGLSGVGSTAGRAFNVPGLASNVSNRTVGQSLGGAAGQISGAAGRAGYAGEANALMNMRNPFAGEGTWRGLLGDELSAQITTLSAQLEEQTGRHGIAAEVEAALDGHTPNWDVWLKVSPETIEAFNKLGEAKADRENAAYDVKEAEEALTEARKNMGKTTEDEADRLTKATEKVTDAEKELAKAREGGDAEKIEKAERKLRDAEKSRADDIEKQAEGASKAADDVAKAEMNLVKAREKEQRAIADLERAHAEYSIAMAVAPVNALMELTSGIVEGTKALADAFERLDDVIQATNEVVVRHEEAQIRSAEATHGAVKAQHALTRSERASRRQQHTDILAVQQAEWDLAMARHEASRTAGAAEVDLSAIRQQGIWDVFQTSQQADQAAIMSAQQVALMEAHLSMVKAEAAVREQQAAYDQQIAMIELEFAQREAEVQAQYLAIATNELAMVQGEAAGIAGYGASAMAKKTEGTAKKQGGLFGTLGSILKGGIGLALASATGGASLLLTASAVAEGIGHVGDFFSGRAQEKAYAEEAQREFDALPEDIKQMIVAQQRGIPLAAAAGALMGAAGGSRDDVATVQQAVQGAFSVGLDIAIAKAQAALQAAEAERQREERQLAAQERQNRLDELNARLEADLENFDKEDTLAEILEVARQQYQEMLQENKQLGELNKNLSPKNQAVLMQLGGSQWGDGSGPTMDVGRGFAGLTAGMLDPYGSAGMEDQWLDAASRARMVAPWLPSEEEWLASQPVEGLPETVADGLYAAAEGAVSAALSGAQGAESLTTEQVAQIVAETVRIVQESGSTTQVGTQFTGDVTIQGAQATDTITALAEQLAKA